MIFRHRRISDEKAKQLNSLKFINPEKGDIVDFSISNFAVLSDDDYYCLTYYYPTGEFIREFGVPKYITYVLFYGSNYVILKIHTERLEDEIVGDAFYLRRDIYIEKNDFFEKQKNEKIMLALKEALVAKNQPHSTDNYEGTICKVYYNGEEI